MFEYTLIAVLFAIPPGVVGMYFALQHPRFFFAAYLLLFTRLFGFMPIDLGLYVNAVMFCLHCGMILSVATLLLMGRKIRNRTIRLFLVCVSGLIVFGLLYPFFLGFSSIQSAIVDGKGMFAYATLAYLAIHCRRFDFNYFLKLYGFVGVVLTVVLVVGHVFNYCPPSYSFVWGTNIVHVDHTLYISLAACLVASRMLRTRISAPDALLFPFLASYCMHFGQGAKPCSIAASRSSR